MIIDHSTYVMVRKSMAQGIRTVEDFLDYSNYEVKNEDEAGDIKRILGTACKCLKLSVTDVEKMVKFGATSVEEIIKPQEGVRMCNKCTHIIQNIIDQTK